MTEHHLDTNNIPIYVSVAEVSYLHAIKFLEEASKPQVTYSEDQLELSQQALKYMQDRISAAIGQLKNGAYPYWASKGL